METGCTCRECGKEFDSRRSLHAHLKAHFDCMGDYYVKHYPKKDLLTGEQIPCLNYDQYVNQDFTCESNFKQWVAEADETVVKFYILNRMIMKKDEKNIKYSPPDLFYKLSHMAGIDECKRLFGSYSSFLKEISLQPWFNKNLPKDFWENDCSDLEILIDTREQQPLDFPKYIDCKLDFGDYTAGGDKYSKTFVDRKAVGDFCSTFSGGIDRFKREMDRCVEFNSYMFVVVESSVDQINSENKKFVKNLSYVWHNVKQVMLEYPNNVQFVFAHSRKGAQKIIPKILFYGDSIWNTDVNFFLQRRINGLD
jgi:hypothetical protein